MYGRVVGSSSQSTSANQVDEPGDSPRFAETLAGMEPGGSSSETRAYYLNSGPPIVEIDQRSFDRGLRRFLGRDIMNIAINADFTDREHRFRAIVSTEFRRS
ncbi:hypothetical protein AB7M17_000424 [Bradyrhizobium sp. USDA 377]